MSFPFHNYVPKPYPSYRFHATEKPRVVQSAEEDAALGPGWADNPAAVTAAPASSAPTVPASPPIEAPAEPSSSAAEAAQAQAAELYATPAAKVVESIKRIESIGMVEQVREMELENPRKRPSVIAALDRREAELKA